MPETLRHRRQTGAEEVSEIAHTPAQQVPHDPCERLTRWMQNQSYQLMAWTIWDRTVSGFKPGRLKAMALLDIQPNDRVLFIGEGSGLDFECLPPTVNKANLYALDYSPEMVRQSKLKAKQYQIPEENCLVGDAQALPFTTEKFDKIFFPLSLASIPDPTLALQEAERVLAPGGKIALFEKLVDDEATVSWFRQGANYVAKAVFADINRNLTQMLGEHSLLKIVHYESLQGKLDGYMAYYAGASYRLATLVRQADYIEQPTVQARFA